MGFFAMFQDRENDLFGLYENKENSQPYSTLSHFAKTLFSLSQTVLLLQWWFEFGCAPSLASQPFCRSDYYLNRLKMLES